MGSVCLDLATPERSADRRNARLNRPDELDAGRARSPGLATDDVPADAVEDVAREPLATVGAHDAETGSALLAPAHRREGT